LLTILFYKRSKDISSNIKILTSLNIRNYNEVIYNYPDVM